MTQTLKSIVQNYKNKNTFSSYQRLGVQSINHLGAINNNGISRTEEQLVSSLEPQKESTERQSGRSANNLFRIHVRARPSPSAINHQRVACKSSCKLPPFFSLHSFPAHKLARDKLCVREYKTIWIIQRVWVTVDCAWLQFSATGASLFFTFNPLPHRCLFLREDCLFTRPRTLRTWWNS